MTTEFEPIKALREEIEGVANILKTLTSEVQSAEMKAAEASQHYDNMVKLKAFTEQELVRKRKVLFKLQADAEESRQ
jgi:TnpA family transposase